MNKEANKSIEIIEAVVLIKENRQQTREHHEALKAMRVRQLTDEFRQTYAARAGIESTHAQAVKRSGLRRSRYRGLSKTHLQHVVTAAAINLLRIASWTDGVTQSKSCLSTMTIITTTKPAKGAETLTRR